MCIRQREGDGEPGNRVTLKLLSIKSNYPDRVIELVDVILSDGKFHRPTD